MLRNSTISWAQLMAAETGQTNVPSIAQELPYRELPGEIIEHSSFIPAISSLSLRQRFEKLVTECRAQMIERTENCVVFAVEAAAPFWKRYNSKQRILKATVTIETQNREGAEWLKVFARIEPLYADGPGLDASLINCGRSS